MASVGMKVPRDATGEDNNYASHETYLENEGECVSQANDVSYEEHAEMNDVAESGDHTVANSSTSDDRVEGYQDNISDAG